MAYFVCLQKASAHHTSNRVFIIDKNMSEQGGRGYNSIEPPKDEWKRQCEVKDGISIYQMTVTGTMTVQELVRIVCRRSDSAMLQCGEWEFGRDFDFRAVGLQPGTKWKYTGDMLLFSQRSELIKDVAPWIDNLTFEPLEPILRKRREEDRKFRIQNILQKLGIALYIGGVLVLIILGSVCLSRRSTDDQCTVCGSCNGAIAMVVVGSITAAAPPIVWCGAIMLWVCCGSNIR